jgi:hypothetical protein
MKNTEGHCGGYLNLQNVKQERNGKYETRSFTIYTLRNWPGKDEIGGVCNTQEERAQHFLLKISREKTAQDTWVQMRG